MLQMADLESGLRTCLLLSSIFIMLHVLGLKALKTNLSIERSLSWECGSKPSPVPLEKVF